MPSGTKGKVLSYLLISRSNIPTDAISDVTFSFRIKKTALAKANATVYDIRMVRYLETQKSWQYLNTLYIKEDATYAYYEAESPGFSTFAFITEINAAAPPVLPEIPVKVNTTEANTTEANATSGAAENATIVPEEPPKATGLSVADIQKSPVFLGLLVFLAVVAIIVVAIKTAGRNSVELR